MFRRRSLRVDVGLSNNLASEQRRMTNWLFKMVAEMERELDELREAEQPTNNGNGSTVSPASVVLPLRVQRRKEYLEVFIAYMQKMLTACMMPHPPSRQWFEELFLQLQAEIEALG